ncbi:MAG: hypothetical protein AB7S75_16090 [Desulfococcaceae bacterium]
MKKNYFMALIIFLLSLGTSKLYFFSSPNDMLEKSASLENAEFEKKTSFGNNNPDSITSSSVFEAKQQNVLHSETEPVMAETKQDFTNNLISAVSFVNENYNQINPENITPFDIDNMIQILNDSLADNVSRKNSAKSLIQIGTKDSILAVLKAIIEVDIQENYVFKENLMQIFADVNSVEAAELLTDILIKKSTDVSEIPEDIVYKIRNVIRLMPDETVGEMLTQKYYNETLEENQKILLDINHPVMIARLSADALMKGDNETADRLLEELAGDEENGAIMGMMILARDKSIPLENVSNMLSFWSLSNADNEQSHFAFVEYLGNAEFSPEERAVAAYAIANEKDKEMAISALKKAQLFEEDPLVQESISNALSRITDNTQSAQPDETIVPDEDTSLNS